MTNEWILDVLTDLRNFASANGLGKLEQQLIMASEMAIEDLVSNEATASVGAQRGWTHVAALHRATGGGQNA